MATNLPARSILKQPTPQTTPDEQKTKAEENRKNLNIALYHANQIQQRKDIGLRIFANIETLLEFPSASPFSPSDATRFVSLVRSFQPSDYDNLIEERRIDGKCGYCLCSKEPRSTTLGSSSAWKLKAKGAEAYCSNDCTRKALYVKTQLSEVPAWERGVGEHPKIVLHPDDRATASQTVSATAAQNRHAVHHELALERGDTTTSFRPSQVMTSLIVENARPRSSAMHAADETIPSHTVIEGYEPGTASASRKSQTQAQRQDDKVSTRSDNVDSSNTISPFDEEEDAWREFFTNPL